MSTIALDDAPDTNRGTRVWRIKRGAHR